MRIVCEKCSAAYAIEDRLITPKGVRGQCPRCKHLQVVRSAPAAPPPAPLEIDDALLAPGLGAEASASGCRDCGRALTDAFDQALGICDACRALDAPAAPEFTAFPELSPLEFTETPKPRVALNPVAPGAVRSASREPAEPEQRGPSRGALVFIAAVAVVAVLVGGAFLLRGRDQRAITRDPSVAGPGQGAGSTAIPAEIKAVLPRWQMAFIDVSGDPRALLKAAKARLEEDSPASYDEAREEFQRALLLDPTSDEAIVGYVRALAAGPAARATGPHWDEALSLIRAAEQRGGRTPEEALAHAELLVTRSSRPALLEEARGLAEWVVEGEGDAALKARAHVVIGRTWQTSSGALAVKHFDEALALVPGLARALYFRALAHHGAGEYVLALADLRKRVEADPLHPDANAQLARIYLEGGRSDQARQVYETILAKRPGDIRARLPLAVIAYQVEGRVGEALIHLRGMAKDLENFEMADQVRLLTHLAAAERLGGRANAAAEAAQKALAIAKDDPGAHLQSLLLALDRGVTADATAHLEAMRGRLEDPALESMLEGRGLLLERRWSDAVSAFQKAATSEAWRLQAQLLAGVAAAEAGRRDDAFRFLFEAARSDPTGADPRPATGGFFLQPRELLRGTEGRILRLASDETDVPPRLYEGVLRFHQGEFAAADRLFRQAQDIDARNALAAAWSALAALQRKDLPRAQAAALNAEAYGRQEGIAQYAAGAVALASKESEEAGRLLREALRLEPGFLAAEQGLAELDAQAGNSEGANARLRGIVVRAPGYLPARRLLFSLAKEEGR